MKFYIKQKVFSFKDSFKILDVDGKDVYEVKGKFFSMRNKLDLLNINGSLVYTAEKKLFSFMPRYFVRDAHGELHAEVRRVFGLRPKFEITYGGNSLRVEGTLFGHSFGVFDDQQEVASISKKVISWGDTYEIDVHSEKHTELFLFLVVIIDQVIHEQKRGNSGINN